MNPDPFTYQRAIDHAQSTERADRALVAVEDAAEYIIPPVAMELGMAFLLAVVAFFALAGRRGYYPEWARFLFGAKRTLHHRRELRPKPSPFQPEALHRAHY